jgi:hypothetical protein
MKNYMGIGVAMGVSLGAALGVALHNLSVWIGIGSALGVVFELVIRAAVSGSRNRRSQNSN